MRLLSILVAACLAAVSCAAQPLTNITFAAFDVETTGLQPDTGHILEIGVVKIVNRKIVDRKSWLVNPEVHIPDDAWFVHGIDREMLAGHPPFAKVYPEFVAYVRDTVLLAHNASFDVRFMRSEIQRNKLKAAESVVLDTLAMSRAWFPDAESHSLRQLAVHLDIPFKRLHRALPDAECAGNVFITGWNKLAADATLADLVKDSGKPLSFKETE